MAARPPGKNVQRQAAPPPPPPPLYEYKPAPYKPQARKPSDVQSWQRDRESIPLKGQADPETEALRKLERGQPEPQPAPVSPYQQEPPAGQSGFTYQPPARQPAAYGAAPPPRRPAREYEPEPPPRRRQKSQLPVIKGVGIIVTVVILLAALQVTGTMDDVREFLNRDVSQGLPTIRLYATSSEFQVNRVMASTCRGSELSYTVDIGIPKNYAGLQELVEVTTNPNPTSTTASYWNWTGTIYSGQKVSMAISYHVKAYFKQWKIKAEDSGTTAQVPGAYAGYLQDCWKFTPSDPTIKDLANRICGNTTNVFQKVRQAYTYVNQNIAYLSNSPEEPKSPTKTLSDRNGDCDDQSFFMGSLLRAQGVPAWLELGILYDQSQRHWGGHAWMQVYIPLKNGGAEIVNIDPANDQFLFRDAYRMTDYVDSGNIDDLQSYYISWRYSYTGAPPVRDDRWDAIYFHPSEASVPMEKSGASAGAQAAKDLWKMPGFDLGVLVMAAIGASVLITLRRRRAA